MICKILGNKWTFWLLKGEQFPAVWVFLDRFHRQKEWCYIKMFGEKKLFCVLFLQLLAVSQYDIISLGLYVLPFNVLFFKCIFIQITWRVISSTCAVLRWHTVNRRCVISLLLLCWLKGALLLLASFPMFILCCDVILLNTTANWRNHIYL